MRPEPLLPSSGEHFLLTAPSMSAWPAEIELPRRHFVLFVAADAGSVAPEVIARFARRTLGQGCVYLCAWGPGCEDLETAFDLAHVEVELETGTEFPVLMTTSHRDETLANALWFSLNTAFPAADAGDISFAWVGACFGRSEWADQVRDWVQDQASLAAECGF